MDGANYINTEASDIIDMLGRAGYRAYIAGSCLCGLIMNKNVSEIDILTSAGIKEIKVLFPNSQNCGGYVSVNGNKVIFRLRQFKSRTDENPDLNTDMARRDFTINAIACDNNSFTDMYGGRADIENKIIRCVGDAEKNLSEHPIRMLRAVRLACTLDFSLSEETSAAILKYARLLSCANQNKIREELNKILLSKKPEKIILLHKLGMLKYIMNEFEICFDTPQHNKYHIYNVGEHIVHTVKNTPDDLVLRWAALLHDIGKPDCISTDSSGTIHFYGHHKQSAAIANNILYRLRFDSEFVENVSVLIENHDVRIEPSLYGVKRMMARTGESLFEKLLSLQKADAAAKNPDFLKEKEVKIEEVREIHKKILAENHPYLVSHLLIGRKELMKAGIKRGRDVSDILRVLLNEVIVNPKLNNGEYLIKEAKRLKNTLKF
ncbi:MAG: CCA tRNA nucleotidyltransferase [Oscillospiraceae bacterium]|nr:CCA tRNA nucleotidyltransferase [Oscillospiraceae bacterium]